MLNFLYNIRGSFFMIIPHCFGLGLKEYSLKGEENEFPVFERCPGCLCE
jgi:hypothetical protein